jgi:hypothetical protein
MERVQTYSAFGGKYIECFLSEYHGDLFTITVLKMTVLDSTKEQSCGSAMDFQAERFFKLGENSFHSIPF